MNQYNQEYYFIRNNQDLNNLPRLSPDANTVNRKFEYEAQPQGSAPLIFKNLKKERFEERGVSIMNPLPAVLFCGNDILVTTDIYREIRHLDVPNLSIHPSVYIHDDDEWHENYWFCTFTQRFDCWSREESKYRDKPNNGRPENEMFYGVAKFSLNSELLDETPLNSRLLFKMGASSSAMITCHESIKHLFETEGSVTTPVAEL